MTGAITQSTTPAFLLGYAMLIAFVASACWWLRKSSDTTHSLPIPALREHVDPYEIACMRGGENELIRVVVAHLTALGYLRVRGEPTSGWGARSPQRSIAQPDQLPDTARLSPLERAVLEWFRHERQPEEMFGAGGLSAVVRAEALRYEERLHGERLLAEANVLARARLARTVGMAVVGLVGATRCISGLAHHRPVGYLLFMGAVGLVVVTAASAPGRLSSRGKALLEALRQWAALASSPVGSGVPVALAVAVFGIGILSGTPHAALADAFSKARSGAAAASVDGCGDGCGGCGGCSCS